MVYPHLVALEGVGEDTKRRYSTYLREITQNASRRTYIIYPNDSNFLPTCCSQVIPQHPLPSAPPGSIIINGNHPDPLHFSSSSLVSLKWTPNQLMNGCTVEDKSASWQQAVSVDMKNIIFMHCHQASAV
jgi:hypothetical protein